MGVFAAFLAYLTTISVLVGTALMAMSVLVSDPDTHKPAVAKKPPAPMVRQADRKSAPKVDEKKTEESRPRAGAEVSAAAFTPPPPRSSAAELAKKQANATPTKARPRPKLPDVYDGTALGFAGPPQHRDSPFSR